MEIDGINSGFRIALNGYRLLFGKVVINGLEPNTNGTIDVEYGIRLSEVACAIVSNTGTTYPKNRFISINPSMVKATIYYNYTGTDVGGMDVFWMVVGK